VKPKNPLKSFTILGEGHVAIAGTFVGFVGTPAIEKMCPQIFELQLCKSTFR
jgi:hypothetical protein